MGEVICPLAFCQVVALTKAGTKAMGVHVLFPTHMRHSKTKHIPKQASGRGNNTPMTQSPSLSVSGHRGAGDIPVKHVSPEDEQDKDMHFCLGFPTLAVVPHGGLGTDHIAQHIPSTGSPVSQTSLCLQPGIHDSHPCLPQPVLHTAFNC